MARTVGYIPKQVNKPLEKMTVAELKAYAVEHKVDLAGADKKEDILAAIKAAEGKGDE